MKHNYYVVYRVRSWPMNATIATVLQLDFRIDSLNNYDRLMEYLEKLHNTKHVFILNWIELK